MRLTCRQFTSATEVRPIQRCTRVDDEEAKPIVMILSDRIDNGFTATNLDSDMSALALMSRAFWWSALYARAYATLSRTSSPFNP